MDFGKIWRCLKSPVIPDNHWTQSCNRQSRDRSEACIRNNRYHSDSCLPIRNTVQQQDHRQGPTTTTPESRFNVESCSPRCVDGNVNACNPGSGERYSFSGTASSCPPVYDHGHKTQRHTIQVNSPTVCSESETVELIRTERIGQDQQLQEELLFGSSCRDTNSTDGDDNDTFPIARDDQVKSDRFDDDLGSRFISELCPFEDCDCKKTEWSPFLSSEHHESDDSLPPTVFQVDGYEDRSSPKYISERSCYSTESNESPEGYDCVTVKEITLECGYYGNTCGSDGKAERLQAPSPTSPYTLVESKDGFKTAPNSQASQEEFVLVDSNADSVQYDIGCDEASLALINRENGQTSWNRCKNTNAVESIVHPQHNNFIGAQANAKYQYVNNSKEQPGRMHGYKYKRHSNYRVSDEPNMPTPQLLPVETMQYEADPKSGKVRSVGKGSFGQVFKARFADPAYHHLSIVVKEFDEEFTTRGEIIEEARRLLFLRDTGYVPVCYGILCLGSAEQPLYGIVQEYIGSGLTLEQFLWDHCGIEAYIWVHIGVQCCEGLYKFHTKGILLNDIKTNNIILDFSDSVVRIKYIDFGLATGMRGKRYKNTKSLEEFVYLAPEVRLHGAVTNIASDIYSLGYMLDQIGQYSGQRELRYVAGLCMDMNPDMRIPVNGASSLLQDHLANIGYHYLPW